MIGTITQALAPVVFVTVLGWIAGHWRVLPESAGAVLSGFVVRFALPINLFLAAAAMDPKSVLNGPYLATIAIGFMAIWAIGLALGYRRGHTLPEAAMRGVTTSCPNVGYCGPPVLVAAVGSSGMLTVVVGNLMAALVMIPLTLVLLEGGAGIGKSLRSALVKPLVLLPPVGLVIAFSGLHLPDLVRNAADEIGRSAGGVALFALGFLLSGIEPRINRQTLLNVGLKNILQPLAMVGLGFAFGLRGDLLKEVLLLGVLPAATIAPALALAHETYAREAARSVLVSTVLALPGIAAGIAIAGLM